MGQFWFRALMFSAAAALLAVPAWADEWSGHQTCGGFAFDLSQVGSKVSGTMKAGQTRIPVSGSVSGSRLLLTWNNPNGSGGRFEIVQAGGSRVGTVWSRASAGAAERPPLSYSCYRDGAPRSAAVAPPVPAKPREPVARVDCKLVQLPPACVDGTLQACESAAARMRFSDANPAAAACLLEANCARGDGQSCRNMAVMLAGRELVADEAARESFGEKACGLGVGAGCFMLGLEVRKRAKAGGPEAGALLGMAVKHLTRGCELKNADCCTQLERDFGDGSLDLVSDAVVRGWLTQRCTAGQSGACVAVQSRKALDTQISACSVKQTATCWEAGYALHGGLRVPKDQKRALGLWKAGCDGGNCRCCAQLAEEDRSAKTAQRVATVCEAQCRGQTKRGGDNDEEEDGEDTGDSCRTAQRAILAQKPSPAMTLRLLSMQKTVCKFGTSFDACDGAYGTWLVAETDLQDKEMLPFLAEMCAKRKAADKWYTAPECEAVDARKKFREDLASCAKKSAPACTKSAQTLERYQRFARALTVYEAACSLGSASGCLNAARIADSGNLPSGRDDAKAAALREKVEAACRGEDADACVELSAFVKYGNGKRKADPQRAAELLTRAFALTTAACSAGKGESCHRAAVAALQGRGTPASPAVAREWFGKGCEAGNAESCRFAGANHLRPTDGTPSDPAKADAFFVRACTLGDAAGCKQLRQRVTAQALTPSLVQDVTALLEAKCTAKVEAACPSPVEEPGAATPTQAP